MYIGLTLILKYRRGFKFFIDLNEMKYRNLDTLIGRTAHILFLECAPLLRMVVSIYDQFFS